MNGNGAAVVERAVPPIPPIPVGLATFLVSVGMLFTALAAAYLVRRTGADWSPAPVPTAAWLGLGALGAASGVLEASRRRASPRFLALAGLCALAFLAAQGAAGAALAASGVLRASHPHAAFYTVLATLHGAHVLGGLVALGLAGAGRISIASCAAYWHFLGVVWLAMLAMLAAG